MVVAEAAVSDIGSDDVLLTRRIAHDFTTGANALVRLNMRTGRNSLQENLDWFCTLFAFEGQDTGGLVHFFEDNVVFNVPSGAIKMWFQLCAPHATGRLDRLHVDGAV